MNDYDIAEIYKNMELHLIRSMRRNLGRHLKDEEAEGFEWKMWQAEKLKELKRFQKENKKIIKSYTEGLPKDISDILKDEFKQGAKSEKNRYNKLFDKKMSDSFFKLNDRKLNSLIKVVNNDLNKGNNACLRMINDVYRKTIYKAATYTSAGVMTTRQAVDMATKDFLNAGLNVIEYKDGRRVNIASYSQMAVRTASQRAMLMGEGEFRKEIGETLVIISRHGTACEICKPFETKVFIDDVYSDGKPDGKHELLSNAMEQGLFHPNCRHGVNTYYGLEGIDEAAPVDKVPVDNDDPEVSRIDVAMRKEQRKVEGCLDKENREKAEEKLKELEAEKEKVVFGDTGNISEYTTNKLKPFGIEKIDLSQYDDNIAQEISNRLITLTSEYDTRLKIVGKTAAADFKTKVLEAAHVTVSGDEMLLTKLVGKELSTIEHEFAHTLANEKYDTYIGVNKDFWKEIQKVKTSYKKELKNIDKKLIVDESITAKEAEKLKESIYLAGTNMEMNNYALTNLDEFMAVAFEFDKNNLTNSKYAKEVVKIIDKYFKR